MAIWAHLQVSRSRTQANEIEIALIKPESASSQANSQFDDRPLSPTAYLRVSPLLVVSQGVVWLLWHISLIEYWKAAWIVVFKNCLSTQLARSFAIDSYMILKWTVLATLVYFEIGSRVAILFMSYLTASTLFSYFYYHVWRPPTGVDSHTSQIRRTVTFLLSFFFGIVAYAYILFFEFRAQIEWPVQPPRFEDAILMSLSNAFTASFASFPVHDDTLRCVLAGEVIFVFTFLVIVIVNSVPTRQ